MHMPVVYTANHTIYVYRVLFFSQIRAALTIPSHNRTTHRLPIEMKFLLLLAFVVLVRTDEIKKDQGVLVLEKDTFQAAVTDNKFILVEFCKYSKTLLISSHF